MIHFWLAIALVLVSLGLGFVIGYYIAMRRASQQIRDAIVNLFAAIGGEVESEGN